MAARAADGRECGVKARKSKRPRKVTDAELIAMNWQLELAGATYRFARVDARHLMTVPFIIGEVWA